MSANLLYLLQNGDTPLVLAITGGYVDVDVVSLLLEKGADIEAQDKVRYSLNLFQSICVYLLASNPFSLSVSRQSFQPVCTVVVLCHLLIGFLRSLTDDGLLLSIMMVSY
jgi:hypothetical protein